MRESGTLLSRFVVFFNKENPGGERPPLYVQDGTPGYGKSGGPGLAAACKQLINSEIGGRIFILCCRHQAAALLGILLVRVLGNFYVGIASPSCPPTPVPSAPAAPWGRGRGP